MEHLSLKEEIQELILELKAYFETRYDLARLNAIDRAAKLATAVIVIFMALLMVNTLLVFLSVAAAFYFGDMLNSNALGFLVVSGIYFGIIIFMVITRKFIIRRPILRALIKAILNKKK